VAVLTNEKYVGNNVYNRHSFKLKKNKISDEELLDHLRGLYSERGSLTGEIIDQALGNVRASASVYVHRFGSLTRAYELVGFRSERPQAFLEINRRLRQLHPEIVQRAEQMIAGLGGSVRRDEKTDLLICPEAINLLQDKQFTPDVTRILRNMKSARQVEAVELMVTSNTIAAVDVKTVVA
jgi:hypothetical protein